MLRDGDKQMQKELNVNRLSGADIGLRTMRIGVLIYMIVIVANIVWFNPSYFKSLQFLSATLLNLLWCYFLIRFRRKSL